MNMTKLLIAVWLLSPMRASADWDHSAWDPSPANWGNSPANWENSQANWDNHPANWDNSSAKWGNTRIIRDEGGQPVGYAVPKASGGMNFYTPTGQRSGYLPGR